MVGSSPIDELHGGEEREDPLLSFLQLIQHTAQRSFAPSAAVDPTRFLDLSLKIPRQSASGAFCQLVASSNGSPEAPDLCRYLEDHFEEVGADVEPYEPPDFEEDGPEGFLPRVENEEVRRWGMEVHRLWRSLSKRVRERRSGPARGVHGAWVKFKALQKDSGLLHKKE